MSSLSYSSGFNGPTQAVFAESMSRVIPGDGVKIISIARMSLVELFLIMAVSWEENFLSQMVFQPIEQQSSGNWFLSNLPLVLFKVSTH